MIINDVVLDEILANVEYTINEIVLNSNTSTYVGYEQYLSKQYDIHLDNLLQTRQSSIHHLESSMKNKIILRKQRLLEKLKKGF